MKTPAELKKEQEELLAMAQRVDTQKNNIVTRLIEIQGILKYLNEENNNEDIK